METISFLKDDYNYVFIQQALNLKAIPKSVNYFIYKIKGKRDSCFRFFFIK